MAYANDAKERKKTGKRQLLYVLRVQPFPLWKFGQRAKNPAGISLSLITGSEFSSGRTVVPELSRAAYSGRKNDA